MTSIESYLDKSCARLWANPDEAEDVREELRGHLQDLIAEYVSQGLDRRTATDRALAQVGEARSLQSSFGRVHHGDPGWMWRLKGLAVGAVLGGVISLLLPLGGHLESHCPALLRANRWGPGAGSAHPKWADCRQSYRSALG